MFHLFIMLESFSHVFLFLDESTESDRVKPGGPEETAQTVDSGPWSGTYLTGSRDHVFTSFWVRSAVYLLQAVSLKLFSGCFFVKSRVLQRPLGPGTTDMHAVFCPTHSKSKAIIISDLRIVSSRNQSYIFTYLKASKHQSHTFSSSPEVRAQIATKSRAHTGVVV